MATKWFGSGRLGCESKGLRVKKGYFKQVKNKFELIGLRVELGWVRQNFFFFFNKENNIYFPFEKSCNKLLDIKCITLNSPLISRMNSIKLINTYSIILKLYKSQHC